MSHPPPKRLERTRHERASWLGCEGEPLKRSVMPLVNSDEPNNRRTSFSCNGLVLVNP
jgi:hypothetical protein